MYRRRRKCGTLSRGFESIENDFSCWQLSDKTFNSSGFPILMPWLEERQRHNTFFLGLR